MAIHLRDGTEVQDPRLDRLVEFDERSRGYSLRALVAAEAPSYRLRNYTWRCSQCFDQLNNGACVWFCLGHELNARPCEVQDLTFQFLLQQYHLTQHRDPWTGCHLGRSCPISPSSSAYHGTSVLAGVKQAMTLGHFSEYRWAFTLEEVLIALGYFGPVMMGTWWYANMEDTDPTGYLHPGGQAVGGHAWLARGLRLVWPEGLPVAERSIQTVDMDRSAVLCRNSWGRRWGANGDFLLTLRSFDNLRREEGEACIPVARNLSLRAGPHR